MLGSFEELVMKCLDENAGTHIREAIKCYEAGAYRSAIVAAYVAVSFDLIQKLRALSAAGDAEANLQVKTLDAAQVQQAAGDPLGVKGLLEFERTLFNIFRDKFEFFGVNEHEDMLRLQQDRNRCAHPTFQVSSEPYQPSAELARLHVRNALAHVLTQEPRQGKAALAEIQNIVLSNYFPLSEGGAQSRLEGSALKNGKPVLIKAFIDAVMFGAATKDGPYFGKAATVFAVKAISEMHKGIAVPRTTTNANKLLKLTDEAAIRMATAVALRIVDVGEGIDAAGRVVMEKWVEDYAGTAKANILVRGQKLSWLREKCTAEIAKITSKEIKNLTVPASPELLERVVGLFCTVGSYAKANAIAADAVVPLVPSMTSDQIEAIMIAAATGAADLKGASGFDDFLDAVAASHPLGIAGRDALKAKHGVD